ncbi:MAG: prolyl-tRNA synthetase associated domain-containing protein [Alphaproteobacteria bacterium]|nr:prolyl-tRNA synthetase associated domain-containing protein [Alphaproteobacteria bacterium]
MQDAIGEDGLYQRLDALRIAHRTIEHDPAFTVAESQAILERIDADLGGASIKNLFLRDKKKSVWLAVVLEDRKVDLKALKTALGAKGNLSFGSPELLIELMGVIPGAVTPFGVINDRENRIAVVLDKAIFDQSEVNAHPLRNDRTTQIACADLLTFLKAEGKDPTILDFDALKPLGATEAAG